MSTTIHDSASLGETWKSIAANAWKETQDASAFVAAEMLLAELVSAACPPSTISTLTDGSYAENRNMLRNKIETILSKYKITRE
jgi:hypothetical protein